MAEIDTLNTTAQGQLKSLVERGEQEKAEVAAHIKEIYAEAKGSGFDAKILRRVVAYRKQDRARRQEEEAVLDVYLSALGELPLFEPREPETHVSIRFGVGGLRGGRAGDVRAALSQVAPTGIDDPLYPEARDLVIRDDKPSVTYIQRRLQLGYNRAAALMERLEREGFVTPADASGLRTLLTPAVAEPAA